MLIGIAAILLCIGVLLLLTKVPSIKADLAAEKIEARNNALKKMRTTPYKVNEN